MSKRSQRNNKPRSLNLYLIGAVVLVALAAVAFFATRSPASAAQDLSPAAYQTQFLASNTAHFLLDVRTAEEFASGHIHGAVNISVDELQSRLSEVPTDQPIVVYCRSGNRSAQASQILAQAGYSNIYDMGGLNDWTAQGYPVE
ncbi:MAG: rhodanese-like domain-containing protein [Anaerolineae bacterium]